MNRVVGIGAAPKMELCTTWERGWRVVTNLGEKTDMPFHQLLESGRLQALLCKSGHGV